DGDVGAAWPTKDRVDGVLTGDDREIGDGHGHGQGYGWRGEGAGRGSSGEREEEEGVEGMPELVVGAQGTPNLRLVRPLARGGMGRVWIAEHLGLRTQVVVKFMSDALAQHPEALARFSREAAAASQVKSPHVVHMIDFGVTPSGTPYIAMEHLEGK